MKNVDRIRIIGIGDDGLDGLAHHARATIEGADLLVGAPRTLELVPAGSAARFSVGADLDEAVRQIEAAGAKKVAVLAQGDPLFYGLARYLCTKLGKERFEIVPHVSTMQLAFARVMESWDDAYLTDLANHPLESVIERIRTSSKAGLFTTDRCTPADVARTLLEAKVEYFSAYVCENLGSRDERVTQGELSEVATLTFAPLNVMILIRKPNAPDRPAQAVGLRRFGNPDDAFLQTKPKQGLVTSAELRSLALAEMDIGPASIVWDVGAGSGSVSIEAAILAVDGRAYAIEMDPQEHALIAQNAARFHVDNVTPVLGRAPEAWVDLPDPDAVFLQGIDREISRVAAMAYERLRSGGRLVACVRTVDNLADLHRTMTERSSDVKGWMLNLARGTNQLGRLHFEGLSPSFLLSLVKR